MYTPRSFAESDLPTLFDYLDAHPLGILISAADRLASGDPRDQAVASLVAARRPQSG